MSRSLPTVVIGGGHNGLTAAALLARAGRKVILLEARDVLGGIAASEEFHPGFFSTGLWHTSNRVRPSVIQELALEGHGFSHEKTTTPVHIAQVDGPGLTLHRDPRAAHAEINVHSSRDAEAYGKWHEDLEIYKGAIEQIVENPPVDPETESAGGFLELLKSGLALRLLGGDNLVELTRIIPMCAADWWNERFETELLKCGLAAPSLLGNWCGPWSPGTAGLALLHESTSTQSVHGGPAALIGCLERAARHHGAELRTASRVERIEIQRGRVAAVHLASGEALATHEVLCACDPKTALLELLEPRSLSIDVAQGVQNLRTRGTTAKVHLALDELPHFVSRPDAKFEHAMTGETLDDLERAFDPVKYGELPSQPHLDIRIPSVSDPELAPPGKHVASILVHFVPRAHKKGWSDAQRSTLQKLVLKRLATIMPGIEDRVLGCETLTPLDLEERYGLSGGHVFHGEHALDQLMFMRPEPHCSRFSTTIDGLYLGSSGSHPGGGITCGPGALGARALRSAAR